MWALFMVLNETHRLAELLEALRKQGVDNLTVMHSASYEAAFAGKPWLSLSQLRWLPGQQMVHTDTVLAIVEGDARLSEAVDAAEAILTQGEAAQGFLFAFPLGLVKGLPCAGEGG